MFFYVGFSCRVFSNKSFIAICIANEGYLLKLEEEVKVTKRVNKTQHVNLLRRCCALILGSKSIIKKSL
jgi:hypothetical protein